MLGHSFFNDLDAWIFFAIAIILLAIIFLSIFAIFNMWRLWGINNKIDRLAKAFSEFKTSLLLDEIAKLKENFKFYKKKK